VVDRPLLYSNSKAITFSSIFHFLKTLKKLKYKLPKCLTILPPTYPFLKVFSIQKCYKRIINFQKFDSISISSYTKSNSYPFTMALKKNEELLFDKTKFLKFNSKNFERPQDLSKIFSNSASIRISKIEYFFFFLKKSNKFINFTFNKKSSIDFEITKKEAFDINNHHDLLKA
jgi:CMP-N-acetylneuraminic acid synthetase